MTSSRSKRRVGNGSKRSAPSPQTPTRPKRACRDKKKTDYNVDSDSDSSLSSLSSMSSMSSMETGDTIHVAAPSTSEAGDMPSAAASRPRRGDGIAASRRASKPPAVASSSRPLTRASRKQPKDDDNMTKESVDFPSLSASAPQAGQKIAPPRPQMAVELSNDNVFIAGDPPTQKYEEFTAFPPQEIAEKMVITYFEMAATSIVVLHKPTVDKWLKELLSENNVSTDVNESIRRRAIMFMIFAEAECYMEGREGEPNVDKGMQWFQYATEQLISETGEPKLGSVQARIIQCFFLLARGRMNRCWSLFGEVVTLIYKLNLHKKNALDREYSMIEVECEKRAFYAAFSLDKFLSYGLNRPQYIRQGDADQDFPKIVVDAQLTDNVMWTISRGRLGFMTATKLHAELSFITSGILADFCGVRPPKRETHLKLVEKHRENLDAWRAKAAILLDVEKPEIMTIYRAQKTTMLVAYNQALVLLYRPFILLDSSAVEKTESFLAAYPTNRVKANIKMLMGACHEILSITKDLYHTSPYYKNSWFLHYCAFSAIVIYYITAYQNPKDRLHSPTIFKKSKSHHAQLASLAEDKTFGRYCVNILNEMKRVVINEIGAENLDDSAAEDAEEAEETDDGKPGVMEKLSQWGFTGLCDF